MLARLSLVALLLLPVAAGCASKDPAPAPADTKGKTLHAAMTLLNSTAAPTDVNATVPGVGTFTTAGPPEGTLVVTHDPKEQVSKIDLEVRLAEGQTPKPGEMVTFTFDHAGGHEESGVLPTVR